MKKVILLVVLALNCIIQMCAQNINLTRFERNYTSLIASMDPVYDNAGEACALIRFYVRDDGFEIEPNLGYLRVEKKTGEIRVWLPAGTKRLTIRHKGAMTLSGYEIPMTLEPKVTYEAELEIAEKKKVAFPYNIFTQVGYNVLSISGPSVSIGADISHHIVELNAVYGLNKTDDWYFYNTDGSVNAAYNYQAFRVGLRYGYNIKATEIISIIPQIGAAFNFMNGTSVAGTSGGSYKSANSISGLVAAKLAVALSKSFWLQVTPEYNFGISKNDVCKLVGENDNTFKSWTDGVNLNVGLMIYF